MSHQHSRRPSVLRLSAATFGIRKYFRRFRVTLRLPGAGRGARPVYLGLFPSSWDARRARDAWLLANVAGAADVYPWLRGKTRDVEVLSEAAVASNVSRGAGVVV